MSAHQVQNIPETATAVGWDVIPLCDIRLGELFAANLELHGKYIDIDTDAAKHTLEQINPGSAGELLFIAGHDYLINAEGADSANCDGVTSRVRRVKWLPFTSFNGNIKVIVAIGGSSGSIPDDESLEGYFQPYFNRGLDRDENEIIQTLLDNRKRWQKILRRKDPCLNLSAIAKTMGSTKDEVALHSTVVHELCHVADSLTQLKEDRKAVRKNHRRNVTAPFLYYEALAVGYNALNEYALHAPFAALYAGELAIITMGIKSLKNGFSSDREYKRAGRPTEARAYAIEERASDFPSVITFKSLS